MVRVISCGYFVLETHLSVSWQANGGKGRTDEAVDRRNESTPNHVKHVETSRGGQMQTFKVSDTAGTSLEDYTAVDRGSAELRSGLGQPHPPGREAPLPGSAARHIRKSLACPSWSELIHWTTCSLSRLRQFSGAVP